MGSSENPVSSSHIESVNRESSLRHMPHQNYSVFGLPTDFSELNLPNNRDVLRYYFFLSDCYKVNSKMFSYGCFTSQVADRLINIWKKLDIAIVDKRSVVKKLNTFLNMYHKKIKRISTSEIYKSFLNTMNNIFYIGKCRCNLKTNLCACGMIPQNLKEFMLDQHTSRKYTIPEIVAEISELVSEHVPASDQPSSYRPCSAEMDIDDEIEFQAPAAPKEIPLKRGRYSKRYTTRNFAMACDRFGISDRVASLLATALFRDIGFKDKRGEIIVMDKAKVAREKKKCRDFVRPQSYNNSDLIAFSFDGRKDNSLARENIGGKNHTNLVKEPHIVIAQEPQTKLLGHIIVNAENAAMKQRQINEFFVEKDISLSNLIGICCDGEVTNTGSENGILRKFEIMLDRPLHWFVCLLHFNELPFRHLFSALDKSTTSGPRSSSGILSKLMETCENQQVGKHIFYLDLYEMFI